MARLAGGGRVGWEAAGGSDGEAEEGGGALRAEVGVVMSRPTAWRRRVFWSLVGPVVGWSRERRVEVISGAVCGGRGVRVWG